MEKLNVNGIDYVIENYHVIQDNEKIGGKEVWLCPSAANYDYGSRRKEYMVIEGTDIKNIDFTYLREINAFLVFPKISITAYNKDKARYALLAGYMLYSEKYDIDISKKYEKFLKSKSSEFIKFCKERDWKIILSALQARGFKTEIPRVTDVDFDERFNLLSEEAKKEVFTYELLNGNKESVKYVVRKLSSNHIFATDCILKLIWLCNNEDLKYILDRKMTRTEMLDEMALNIILKPFLEKEEYYPIFGINQNGTFLQKFTFWEVQGYHWEYLSTRGENRIGVSRDERLKVICSHFDHAVLSAEDRETVLKTAAYYENLTAVSCLLDQGYNLNQKKLKELSEYRKYSKSDIPKALCPFSYACISRCYMEILSRNGLKMPLYPDEIKYHRLINSGIFKNVIEYCDLMYLNIEKLLEYLATPPFDSAIVKKRQNDALDILRLLKEKDLLKGVNCASAIRIAQKNGFEEFIQQLSMYIS